MTDLHCTVSNCANNQDSLCCRPDIMVSGPDSWSPKQTFCANFVDRQEGGEAQNSVDSESPNPTLDIHCEAVNCAYNQQLACNANHVDIRTTHVNGSQIKTECSTFQSDSH